MRPDTHRPIRNLDHVSDGASSERARRELAARRRSLEDLGTTAKRAPLFKDPEWTKDLEYTWRVRTADELARLDARAKEQHRAARQAETPSERVTLERSAEWAEHRARAMAMPREALVGTCGKRWRTVACSCGEIEIPVGCDQVQLCDACSKRRWRRWRKRITRAMEAHLTAARGQWWRTAKELRVGMCPGVYLITFTMPHSGSIVIDRETMGKAWRVLTKTTSAERWWGHYALTWEVTPGTRGDGHVHMHVAVISSWVPYDALRVAWQAAMPGAIQPDVQPPRRAQKGSQAPAQSAADYLAKYVTKGVDPRVFTGQKAGELLVAFRGKRRVTTSLEFWKPNRDREVTCQKCGERHRALGSPEGLASVAPGIKLHPRGWWDVGRRRREQCSLRVDTA